ncbi:Aste57867_7914 [Aphanomyces stellatus]|uniref:Aste57867_7914 protein n=1 Tax=Aphanomyces stellatus TaxID=120398 RepID=A0A485KIZ4_9STRA|nr:hypothetical protein As57867_007884 [Aphanomyces stellatus]VFT84807.1 Aste57867_7914 [Aphanomyces stellatus]
MLRPFLHLALAAATAMASAHLDIINGVPSPVGSASFVAGLRQTSRSVTYCGASLIAPTFLLTAAHCVDEYVKYVDLGAHYAASYPADRAVEIIDRRFHPRYTPTSRSYDLAIVEIKTPSPHAPVKLLWDDDPEVNGAGVSATARGFGVTNASTVTYRGYLMETTVIICSNPICEQILGSAISDSMLCAGGGRFDTCRGDGGGPLTVIKDGEEYITGVTSWGDFYSLCGHRGVPGVYARVSKARAFIEGILAGNKSAGLPKVNPSLVSLGFRSTKAHA